MIIPESYDFIYITLNDKIVAIDTRLVVAKGKGEMRVEGRGCGVKGQDERSL